MQQLGEMIKLLKKFLSARINYFFCFLSFSFKETLKAVALFKTLKNRFTCQQACGLAGFLPNTREACGRPQID